MAHCGTDSSGVLVTVALPSTSISASCDPESKLKSGDTLSTTFPGSALPFGEDAVSSFHGIFVVLSCGNRDTLIEQLRGRINIVVCMFRIAGMGIMDVGECIKGDSMKF